MALIPLQDIEQAAQRIQGRVRRTPFLRARYLREPLHAGTTLVKLECLQVSGSFKARGASNAAAMLTSGESGVCGVVTASGGNHGAAVAYAGVNAGMRAVVYVPESTPVQKIERIRSLGGDVVIHGEVWDDAQCAALAHAERDGLHYIHPFADPVVIAGQGTLGLEMLKQSPECDVFVIAVGGGGLIAGLASAIHQIKPTARIIGVEPEGAPTLARSMAAGELVTLDAINTRASSLCPRRSAPINLDIVRQAVEQIVLVSDEEMVAGARWLWDEMGVAAEMSAGAAVAAVQCKRIAIDADETLGVLICGAGTDGLPVSA